jgi:uncharacterized Tic20 family protein
MMSDEEKDKVEAEVEAEGVGEVEGEGEVKAEGESVGEAEVEVEAKAEVEGEVEAEESAEPAETSVVATSQAAQAGPTANERTWAALSHASVLLTFALGVSTGGLAVVVAALVPLGIWLAFRDRSRFVAFHAMQATVFQLASLVVWIGLLAAGLVILIPAWIVTAILLVVLVGLLLLPVALVLTLALAIALMALPFASLFYGLYGAFEVYGGRAFRYWQVADWIESRGVRIA